MPTRRHGLLAAAAQDASQNSKRDQAPGAEPRDDGRNEYGGDTFARFIDVLASTLDDHEATGEALASRVHLRAITSIESSQASLESRR